MLYEIRHYITRPGRRDEWVRYFDEKIVPYEVEKGVVVVASFRDADSDDGFIWIRAFTDENHRDEFSKNTPNDPVWINEIGPGISELLLRDQTRSTQVLPTASSALQ